MISRPGERAEGDSLATVGDDAPSPAFSTTVRVVILCTLLLLAVYTVLTVLRINRAPPPSDPERESRAQAELLAMHAQTIEERLRGGALAGAEVLRRAPDESLDAAEAALRLARPVARAAAVVGEEDVEAVAGAAPGAAWTAAVAAAKGSDAWIGSAGASAGEPGRRWIYAVAPIRNERAHLVVAADPKVLLSGDSDGPRAISTPEGIILAGQGVRAGGAMGEVFGVGPSQALEDARSDRVSQGALAGSGTARVAAAETPDRALVAAVAEPGAAGPVRRRGLIADNIFSLLAPLGIGLALTLLLVRQTRKAEAAQQAKGESERKFRLAVEAARCGIWEWRLRDDTVFLSDVTGVMLGWGGGGIARSEDVIARIAPEHRDRVRQALQGASSFGAFDVSFCVPRSQGGLSWIDARGQAFGSPDERGYASITGVALDVTEERTAELRAQSAERRLHDAIDSVSEAFVLWDRQGRLLMHNRNYREFFSLDDTVLRPGASREVVNRIAHLAVKSLNPAPDGRRGVKEAELRDGRWLQISERRTADGGLVMTAADITAVKRQEEARRLNEEALKNAVQRLEENSRELADLAEKYQTEKMRAESANTAKSEFLANMSHELRTPLNAINGFSEMMVGEMFGSLGDPRYKEYAQDILSSGQHLLALINDILDMSKIEAGKLNLRFEPVEIEEVAEDVVRLMRNRADAARLTLSVQIGPDLPEIEADYRALKQVLLNLLSNALKFTPQGGKVELRAESVRASPDASIEAIRISVADTGIGISQEDLARLARPFEQVESQHAKTQQGTGLGLALTKSLVELHEGGFELNSVLGQGTVASFTLPVERKRDAAQPSPAREIAAA